MKGKLLSFTLSVSKKYTYAYLLIVVILCYLCYNVCNVAYVINKCIQVIYVIRFHYNDK